MNHEQFLERSPCYWRAVRATSKLSSISDQKMFESILFLFLNFWEIVTQLYLAHIFLFCYRLIRKVH